MEQDYDHKWQKEHREERMLYLRRWRKKNPNKTKAYCKKWATENKKKKMQWFKRKRVEIIKAKGSKCEICGYNKHLVSLQFHHKNGREENERTWDWMKKNYNLDRIMLVCSNCHIFLHHQDVEEGYIEIAEKQLINE